MKHDDTQTRQQDFFQGLEQIKECLLWEVMN